MNFIKHSNLEGKHAFLSASKYHWLNYSDDKLIESFSNHRAAEKGTELHDFARRCIELGIKLPKNTKTLNLYVNDAIGFRMNPEVTLYYSDNCFGTADAISFKNDILRIHDLKTGTGPTSMHQLEIYASLFCMEYNVKPSTIAMKLRIYQNNEILEYEPETDTILSVMDKIVSFDKIIEQLKSEE